MRFFSSSESSIVVRDKVFGWDMFSISSSFVVAKVYLGVNLLRNLNGF